MVQERYQLTPAVWEEIVGVIRRGGFAHVAAEAAGIPRSVFDRWMQAETARRLGEPYAGFQSEVRRAQAQARLQAESVAFSKDAKYWLEHGPGKEKPDDPGWSASVKASVRESTLSASQVLMHPEVMQILGELSKLVSDHPKVHMKFVRILDKHNVRWS